MQFLQREQKLRSEAFPGLVKQEPKSTNTLGMSLMQHPKVAPPPPPPPTPEPIVSETPAPAPRKPRVTKKTVSDAPVSETPVRESTPRATTAGKQKPRKLL
jgi:hypothetical protein